MEVKMSQSILIVEKGCYPVGPGGYVISSYGSQSILIVEKGCYFPLCGWGFLQLYVTIHSDSGKGLLLFTKTLTE